MCTSEKLPYIRIDSNKRDDRPIGLPEIQLNHASDHSLPSSPGSPAQFGSGASSTPPSPTGVTSKQKSSFFQSRKKQISLQPKLLIPTVGLERSVSDCDPRPTPECSEKPLTAPVLGERHQKARASIAFDFNILHYLTKGHYFNNNGHSNGSNGEGKGSFFGSSRSKNKAKFSENDKHSDLESFGSVISLIQRKEPGGKKKKKKKKRSKELDRQESSEPEQLSSQLKIGGKKKKKSRKVLADRRSNQLSSSSSSSSLLSLNNLSSSIERLTSKFKKEKKPRPVFDEDQMLHKYGRVIVPGEPRSFRSMMQWSPSSSRSNDADRNPKENSSRTKENCMTKAADSNPTCTSFVYTHHLPPTNPSLKCLRKEYLFTRQAAGNTANAEQYHPDHQPDHHHHHSRNCHHTHRLHHCGSSAGKQPAERLVMERIPLGQREISLERNLSEPSVPQTSRRQLAERQNSPAKQQPSTLDRPCLERQHLVKTNQPNASNRFSFFKNKILRSRSFEASTKSSKYQVSCMLSSSGLLGLPFADHPPLALTNCR